MVHINLILYEQVDGNLSFWLVVPIVKFYFVLGLSVSFYLLFDCDFPFNLN